MADKIDQIVIPNSSGTATAYDIDLPPDATPSIASLTLSGDATIGGTLYLTRTQDLAGDANNKPAIVIGGAVTAAHMEIDCNEVQAKATGTTTADLYLNNDGGTVYAGGNAVLTAGNLGYTTSNKKYAVQKDSSGNLYVSVPWSDNNDNTTYTFAEGSTNGAFSVTPSGGSASPVPIHGLGSAAYCASTDFQAAGSYAAANHTHDYSATYAAKDHTHLYAGSSTAGGVATSAAKLTDIASSDEASSSATWRYVFISYNDLTTNRPAYKSDLAYQTSTSTLKAPNIVASTSIKVGTTAVSLEGHTHDYAASTHNHDNDYQAKFAKQSKNKVYAGPSTGSDALPSFRKLVVADLPTGTDSSSVALGNHTHDYSGTYAPIVTGGYLPKSGGTMTGNLTLLANQYNREGALNCNNSDIMGVNSIYTADDADNTAEGIRFYRDASHYDSFSMHNGVMYFMPNDVAAGTAFGSANVVLHSGNISSYAITGHQTIYDLNLKFNDDSSSSITYAPDEAASTITIKPKANTNGAFSIIKGDTTKDIQLNGTFTDVSVSAVTNHYTPSTDANAELTASISGNAGEYAKDTEYTVLTGLKIQRDAAGHVTGVTYTAQNIKDTNTNTWQANTTAKEGYVAASGNSAANKFKVWMANGTTDPSWSFITDLTSDVNVGTKDAKKHFLFFSGDGNNQHYTILQPGSATSAVTLTLPTTTGTLLSTAGPAASSDNYGGIKTGFTTDATNRNYKVQTDNNGNAYVNVPWQVNSKTQNGYVTAPGNVANKVWKTDGSGNPGWRDDATAGNWAGSGQLYGTSSYAARSDHMHDFLGGQNNLFYMSGDLGVISRVAYITDAPIILTPSQPSFGSNVVDTINTNISGYAQANAGGWAFLPGGGLASRWIDINDDIGIVFHGPVYASAGIYTPSGSVGTGQGDNDAYNYFDYNTYIQTLQGSDAQLKENIVKSDLDVDPLLDKIQVVDFNFKEDPEKRHTLGVIAQELQEILPGQYKEEFIGSAKIRDESYLTVRDNKLVYIALLALQKQKKKIADLEARLEALENK